jgi:hypothetical protein
MGKANLIEPIPIHAKQIKFCRLFIARKRQRDDLKTLTPG